MTSIRNSNNKERDFAKIFNGGFRQKEEGSAAFGSTPCA
jgi:hypothetical protein